MKYGPHLIIITAHKFHPIKELTHPHRSNGVVRNTMQWIISNYMIGALNGSVPLGYSWLGEVARHRDEHSPNKLSSLLANGESRTSMK